MTTDEPGDGTDDAGSDDSGDERSVDSDKVDSGGDSVSTDASEINTDTADSEFLNLNIGSVAADNVEDDEPRYEQSLPGVVIHPLAFLGLVGLGALPAAALYLAARTPFTRANARNALNWHLSVLALGVVTVLALGVGRTEGIITGELIDWQLLPGPVATLVGVVGLVLVIVWMVAWLLTVVFAVVATFNAAAGYTWRYPFAPDLVGRLTERF